MARRIRIKKGNMQDASFIESDKGEYGKPRGNESKTMRSGMVLLQQRIMKSISDTRHIPLLTK
jgi:hypothetical protein